MAKIVVEVTQLDEHTTSYSFQGEYPAINPEMTLNERYELYKNLAAAGDIEVVNY